MLVLLMVEIYRNTRRVEKIVNRASVLRGPRPLVISPAPLSGRGCSVDLQASLMSALRTLSSRLAVFMAMSKLIAVLPLKPTMSCPYNTM